MMTMLNITAFIAAAAILWVLLLRRQVRKQTQLMRERLERETAVEQQYREIFDGANDMIFTHDMEGRFTSINPATCRVLGYSADEAKQLTIYHVLAPEYHNDVRRALSAKVPTREVVPVEVEFVAKDGRRVVVDASMHLMVKDGKPTSVQAIARDITEHKRAERQLKESELLYHSLVEHLPVNVLRKDRGGKFTFVNTPCLQSMGKAQEQILGKTDFDLFPEELAKKYRQDDLKVMETSSVFEDVEKHHTPRGKDLYVHVLKTPIRDHENEISGVQILFWDETGREEVKRELAYERELFRTLLDNIPDAIYFKDLQSRFIRCSKSMVQLFGQADFEAVLGKTDADFFAPDHARPAFEDEQAIIRTGQPMFAKVEKETHADGRITWALTSKIPWRDKDGMIIGTFGISKDITALKTAEAELEATHQRLLETSRLAGMAEVATDVLHNVGNVLNSVNVSCALVLGRVKASRLSGLAKVTTLLQQNRARLAEFLACDPQGKSVPDYLAALAEYADDERAAVLKELEQLRDNIEHIKQIVTMQQSYANVAGVVEAVAVPELVEDALSINAAALRRHGVEVCRALAATTPILTEKHKVLQILVNLIRNAKYALHEASRPDRLLTIKAEGNGDGHVQIQVTDNGVGIPPENLTRIFTHGFTTRRNGHGFGLHSSALAAREIGGSLHAHSDGPNRGATFTLLLPHHPPAYSP
jgi:PAS domain S-box-containing protein